MRIGQDIESIPRVEHRLRVLSRVQIALQECEVHLVPERLETFRELLDGGLVPVIAGMRREWSEI